MHKVLNFHFHTSSFMFLTTAPIHTNMIYLQTHLTLSQVKRAMFSEKKKSLLHIQHPCLFLCLPKLIINGSTELPGIRV